MTNAELAQKLRDLRVFLIVAGYEESHALRYTHIARYIEKMPESAEEMMREHRLTEIPQVGKLIAMYIREIIQTGVSSKQKDWEDQAPYSVVELCYVKGLGPKTARELLHRFQIKNLAELKEAAAKSDLEGLLSEKMRAEIAKTPDVAPSEPA